MLTQKVTDTYRTLKMKKYTYQKPEDFNIQSDQVKAVIKVFSDEIQSLRDEIQTLREEERNRRYPMLASRGAP